MGQLFFLLLLFLFFFFTFAFVVPQDPVECQSRCYFCTRHNGGWRLCSFHFRANGRNGADETINAKFANRWNCRSTTSPFCRSRSSRFFFVQAIFEMGQPLRFFLALKLFRKNGSDWSVNFGCFYFSNRKPHLASHGAAIYLYMVMELKIYPT